MTKYLTKMAIFTGLSLAGASSLLAKPGFVVMGYFPNYATSGPFPGDGAINMNDNAMFPWNRLTHVMEAFALPGSNGSLAWPYGQRANLVLKAHQNNTRAMLSIGGAGSSNATWAANSSTYLNTFVANITTTVAANKYDGVDIDWEFPTAAQMGNFTNLMTALGTALHSQAIDCGGCVFHGQPRQLTFFASPGADICGVDWDNASLQTAVDFCIYGGYDFGAPPGYNSPTSNAWLQTDCRSIQYNFCLTQTVKVLTGITGADYSWPLTKMVLSLPLYDLQAYSSFTHTPLMVALRNGTYSGFDYPQDEARYNLSGSTHYVNNAESFCRKMSWALNNKNMAGIALWEITHLYPQNKPEAVPVWDTIEGIASCINYITPTPGPTPATLPPGLVDVGNSGTTANLWGGTWSAYGGSGGSTMVASYTAAGYAASSYNSTGPYSIQASGNLGTGLPSLSTCLSPACATYNLDAAGYTRVDFWFKGTPGIYRIAADRDTTRASGYDHYGIDFEVVDASWHYYSFYLQDFAQPSWATPDPEAYNDVDSFFFQPQSLVSGTAYTFNVDDLELVKQVVTATPTPPAYLIDTVEDGNNVNNWTGGWTTYNPATNTGVASYTAPGFDFSPYGYKYSVRFTGNNVSGLNPSVLSTMLGAGGSPSVSLAAYNMVNFEFKGNGVTTSYRLGFERASGENWIATVTIPADTLWHHIEIPLVQSSWSYSWGGTAGSWGINNGSRFYWYSTATGAYQFSVDDLYVENRPPTPTPTVTNTSSFSPTFTPSPSPSATPTWSASPSGTPTRSGTPTPTASSTATATSSASPTFSSSASPTLSPSISPTFTNVPAGSTPTPTMTQSPTLLPSPSASPTLANTQSNTPQPSATNTLGNSPTQTATALPSSTATLASTSTRSATPSMTFTNVPAGSSPTSTPTQSPVASPTTVSTLTATPSATLIPTQSATAAASPSVTPTFTNAPAGSSPTSTPTQTVLTAATATPTRTSTATPTTASTLPAGPPTVDPLGPLEIETGVGGGSDQGLGAMIKFKGPVDRVRIRVFTKAMILVTGFEGPGGNTGWISVSTAFAGLKRGVYYYEAVGYRGGSSSKPFIGKFMVLY